MTYLDKILTAHRASAAQDERSVGDLAGHVDGLPAARGFTDALRTEALSVIAEIKRRSPSRGDLAPDLDAAEVAAQYVSGGAACLSVLTDQEFFGGAAADLVAAHEAVRVPVLRKDFTVCARDVYDARIMGADAVLLIVAALSDDELPAFLGLAGQIGLDALVEVHDEPELQRAVSAGAEVIGVNQRDLVTFDVDPDRAANLRPLMPTGVVSVAESGVGGPDDAKRLAEVGYDAVLVGESLVRSTDRAAAVQALRQPVL